MTQFSSAAPASSVNPFGGAPTSMAAGQFSQAGSQGMMPTASVASGQFPSQFAATPASGAGFAQFPPMQNGTGNVFGMPAASPFGGAPAGFPGQPQQQQFMMPAQQAGGWGQMGIPAQPMANPFMVRR